MLILAQLEGQLLKPFLVLGHLNGRHPLWKDTSVTPRGRKPAVHFFRRTWDDSENKQVPALSRQDCLFFLLGVVPMHCWCAIRFQVRCGQWPLRKIISRSFSFFVPLLMPSPLWLLKEVRWFRFKELADLSIDWRVWNCNEVLLSAG